MSDTITLSITIYGIAIVISFLVAALIRGIVVALPMINRPAAPEAQPAPAPAAVAAIPPEHVAAITAAVTAIVGPRHIIHFEDQGRAAAWTFEGRMMHQTSHAVPRRSKS